MIKSGAPRRPEPLVLDFPDSHLLSACYCFGMRAETAIEQHLADLIRAGGSRPTHRQRGWALRQALTGAALYHLYDQDPPADHRSTTDPEVLARAVQQVTVTQLLDPQFIAWFLPWAATGALAETPTAGRSLASARARAVSLRALAKEFGPVEIEHTHDMPELRPPTPVTGRVLAAAIEYLTAGPSPRPARTRLGALLVVMLNYPARPWQLCQLTIDDVRQEAGHLELAGPDGWIRLSAVQSQLLGNWLDVRQQLVDALLGSAPPQLWVAVRSHQADGHVRPAGLPLHPRGLERSYVTHVRSLNVELLTGMRGPLPAGHGGAPASHLPLSMDLLRRSILNNEPGPQSSP
jgi:integrase